MTAIVLLGLVLAGRLPAGVGTAQPAAAAQKEEPAASRTLGELAQLGPGVHRVKLDNKGRVRTCIIVGQSRISTVLGRAKGLQNARAKARLACEAEFVRWLKTRVDVHIKNEEETILFLEGREGNDKDALRESGKSVEKTTQKFQSTAQGLVRGLQVLGVVEDAKDRTLTLVMGWSARGAGAARQTESGRADGAPGGRGAGSPDKRLRDRRVVSPDLKKYLD